jgi:hypothetical protein
LNFKQNTNSKQFLLHLIPLLAEEHKNEMGEDVIVVVFLNAMVIVPAYTVVEGKGCGHTHKNELLTAMWISFKCGTEHLLQ